MKVDSIKVIAGIIVVASLLLVISTATETTWRHAGFEVYGYDINFTEHNATNVQNIDAENITSKIIGGVIFANQYDTLQDAIDASDSDNDGVADHTVYIPNGIYEITSAVDLINNSVIIGEDRNKTILQAQNHVSSMFDFNWSSSNPIRLHDIHISNINFDINSQSTTLAINLIGDDIVIENCIFSNTIDYRAVKIGYVSSASAFDFTNKSNNVVFRNNIVENNVGTSTETVLIMNTDNAIITQNRFNNNSDYTTLALYAHSNNGIISDNYFGIGDPTRQIWVAGTYNTLVSGNTIMDYAEGTNVNGLELSHSYDVRIVHNFFNYTSTNGHQVFFRDYSCSDAEFLYCDTLYNNTHDVVISDNVFYRGWHGIAGFDYQYTAQLQHDIIINSNTFIGTMTGTEGTRIYIGSSDEYNRQYKNIQITNNIFNGSSPHSSIGTITIQGTKAYAYSSNVLISGNFIEMNRGSSVSGSLIELRDVQNVRIINNFLNNSANMIRTTNSTVIQYNNLGTYPYYWGNNATAPTPYGAGDEYYNTTDNIKYCYNGSAWNALY